MSATRRTEPRDLITSGKGHDLGLNVLCLLLLDLYQLEMMVVQSRGLGLFLPCMSLGMKMMYTGRRMGDMIVYREMAETIDFFQEGWKNDTVKCWD
jgi:hypothetical protein